MVLRGLLKLLVGFIAAAVIFTAIVGIGGYFAFRNFDPNMFRKQCEDYLAEKTGLRVEFGDIQLEWQPRPSLQVAGLKVYQPKTHQKVLSSERIQIDADLASIWKKRFVVSQVLIQKPEVFLTRDRKGNWVWETIDIPASVPAAPSMLAQLSLIPEAEASEGSTGFPRPDLSRFTEGWELGVGKILVRDATLHVSDESREPALRFDIKKLDAEIRPEISNSAYRFSVEAAILGSSDQNLRLEGALNLSSRSLDLDLRYGAEVVALKGRVNFPSSIPHFEGKLDISGLDIDPVVPSEYKKKPYLAGRLSAKTQFVFDSTDPEIILRTIVASGKIEIKDGALRNRNVVRDAFEKLSSTIVVEGGLENKLPLEVKDMIRGQDTPFDSLEIEASASNALATVSRIQVRHSNYQLSGQGKYGLLNQRADGALELRLSESISSHLAKKIREMALLIEGASGQIVFPLKVQGTAPDISVQPDLVSIGSRVLQEKATQALGEGIERLLGAKRSKASSGLPVQDGGSQPLPSGKGSDRDQLIQQGMALFAKFQESQTAPSPDAVVPSGDGDSAVAGQPSDQEALVQEGMALLSKYREAQKQ